MATVVEASSASSAWPCRNTLGSLSTYTTREARFIVWAIWCVFCTVGRPEPRSRNWVTPWPTMYLTARPRAARLRRAPLPSSPIVLTAAAATARSTAKLSLPPRIASYTRATLGTVVSISGGTCPGSSLAHVMSPSAVSLSAMSPPSGRRASRDANRDDLPLLDAIGVPVPMLTAWNADRRPAAGVVGAVAAAGAGHLPGLRPARGRDVPPPDLTAGRLSFPGTPWAENQNQFGERTRATLAASSPAG